MEKAAFSIVQVLWSWSKLVYVWEAPYNTVFTVEEGLWSLCKPVYVGETPYNAVFTAEVGCEARAGLFKYQ